MYLFESKNFMLDYVKKDLNRYSHNSDIYFIQLDNDVILLQDGTDSEKFQIKRANIWRVRIYSNNDVSIVLVK